MPDGDGRADVRTNRGERTKQTRWVRRTRDERQNKTDCGNRNNNSPPLSIAVISGRPLVRARARANVTTLVSSTAAAWRGNEVAVGERQKLSITLAIPRKWPAFAVERKIYVTNNPAGRVARQVLLRGGGGRRVLFISYHFPQCFTIEKPNP